MTMKPIYRAILAALTVFLHPAVNSLRADEPEAPPAAALKSGEEQAGKSSAAPNTAVDQLVVKQADVADSFARFKTELLKMAERTRASDPSKAELLERAVQQMSSSGTDDQLRTILKLLDSELVRDLDQAIDKQDKVQAELNALLTLLLSQNRDHRNASEKQKIRDRIKQIDQAIRIERGIQGQSERNGELPELSKRQGQLADRTQGIANGIKADEDAKKAEEKAREADEKGSEKKDADRNAGDKKDSDQKKRGDGDKSGNPKNENKPGSDGMKPAEGQPGEAPGKPGDSPKPADGKPSEAKPGMGDAPPNEGQPSDSQPQQEQPNGRKQLEKAVEKMRQAQQRLDDAKRNDAVQQQEEAIAALEQARAELEEILRQLREEEIEKTLARLEARFRIMLKMQQAVKDGTVLLDRKPAAQRDRADEIEAGRLARREQLIIAELDKAALLLREDGSAVAFPEAVVQLREDMEHVAERLGQAKIGSPTQQMEQDVIDALQEMIASLEKAQKDLKQKQQGMSRPGEPADPPLVDSISELKMIRALQVRVNRRTAQCDELVRSGETPAEEMLPKLQKLAEHQQKIHRIARDLYLGKNE